MTRLMGKMMLEELQRRNYSAITTRNHVRAVTEFRRRYFVGKSSRSKARPQRTSNLSKPIC